MSVPFYRIVPQYAELAFGSVTATTAGTATTISTLTRDRRAIVIVSNLNTEVMVTFGGADFVHIPASGTVALDLGSNALSFAKDVILGVYHRGVAPASGRIGITAL